MAGASTGSSRILAGIDIGTLTCRLEIAEVTSSGQVKKLQSDRRILRLGQGVDRDRLLRTDAMARVVTTLKEWRQSIDTYQVEATSVVATSAVRDAGNRQDFLDLIAREAGLQVEIISGEEEARRTTLGIRSGLPEGVSDMLAVDIGGGSTECILDRPGQPLIVRSIDIGVVRLSERVLQSDPPTSEELQRAHDWIRTETGAAVADMPLPVGLTFVGTAGTITALAAMDQQLPVYEAAKIHNYVLTLEAVKRLEAQLLGRSKQQREGLPGLERGREDVIVAGAIILSTMMETLGMTKVLVSDLGLREGVLLHLASRLSGGSSLC